VINNTREKKKEFKKEKTVEKKSLGNDINSLSTKEAKEKKKFGRQKDFKSIDPSKIISKVKEEGIMKKAIKFGVVGLGQGGDRIAEEFEKLGYPVIAVNTSEQDLNKTDCTNKLLIGSGNGAGKDLKIGKRAVSTNKDKIMQLYQQVFKDVDHALVCAGSSGGTGGGGLKEIVSTLMDYKLPVGVMTTMPLATEDTRAKKNTLKVLNQIAEIQQKQKIRPLVIIDNDKIEQKHPGLSTLKFWKVANNEVVKTFDLFNRLAATSTEYSSLDPADYAKIINSGGCMIFGNISINDEESTDTDDIFSKAITDNVNSGLFVEGFNLVESTHVGLIITGNPKKLEKIPRRAEEKAFQTINEIIGSGSVFKGVYGLPSLTYPEVFFMISGLGLPKKRIRDLIKQVKTDSKHFEEKVTHRTVADIMQDLDEDDQIDLDDPTE
jgi:cell division GTPase FtsZ